jgi:HEAT repeat protein
MKQEQKPQADIQAALDRLNRKATRMQAANQLGEWRALEAVEPLLGLCRRVKKEERATICQVLAQIAAQGESQERSAAAIQALVESGLEHKHARVRRCAACALGLVGPPARPAFKPLLRSLDDPSSGVRLEAIEALGKIGDSRAVKPLTALLNDPDADVRECAVSALGAMAAAGDLADAALAAVVHVFEHGEPTYARAAAARALGRIGKQPAEAPLRPAEAPLRHVLQDQAAPLELRAAALSALEDLLSSQVVPLAVAALRDPEAGMRRQAVRCLCNIDTPASTGQLAMLYADQARLLHAYQLTEDKKARAWVLDELQQRYRQLLDRVRAGEWNVFPALLAAWRAMGKKQAAEAREISETLAAIGQPLVPTLSAALDVDTPGVDIIRVLERIGPAAHDAYDALVAQLDNPHIATCCAAARALGTLGDERAIPALMERLSFDADLMQAKKKKQARKRALALQQAAAIGLGRLGKAALLPALEAARSDDPITRRGAALALGHIGGGRALSALDKAVSDPNSLVREAAAEAFKHAAAGDVTRMAKLLQDKDDRVRAKAVRALGKLDDLRSLDLLLRAYGDASERVNKAVVRALVQREGERAYSVLIAAAAGGNVSALRALEKHPTRQAIPALAEALDSPWFDVYSAALQTLRTYVDVFADDARAADDPGSAWAALQRLTPELTYLLHDDSAAVRRLALETLGAFRDPGTVQDIAFLLADGKEDIRFAAAHVLASIGSGEAAAALRDYVERADASGKAIDEDLYAEIVDTLKQLSAGDDTDVAAISAPAQGQEARQGQ